MSIDWFTFTAQIVNFLILVWLLLHFLYKPIMNAMDEREKKISATMDEAITARKEAEAQRAEYSQKSAEMARAQDNLLAEASHNVDQWRAEHLRRARAEVDEAKTQWYHALTRERHSFIREARLRVAVHVHRISSRVLAELADTNLQSRAIEVFLDRIVQIDDQQRLAISAAILHSNEHVRVESGIPLSDRDRSRIVALLREQFGSDIDAEFHEDPELIFGIEVRAAGHKVAWSAREQLERLEEEFAHSLDKALNSEAAAAAHDMESVATE